MFNKLGSLLFGKSADAGGGVLLADFGSGYRYYYSRLTADQKNIYNAVLSGLGTCTQEIELPLRSIDEMSMIFDRILLDNPIIFYISTKTSFNLISDPNNNKCVLKPGYTFSKSEVAKYVADINKYLRTFDGIKNKSDADKEKFIHDFCLDNFRYDYNFGKLAYSVLGPVFKKTAVCEGIAEFVKLAFDYVGVECLVVTGTANNPARGSGMESHAWNIVKIGGRTYHLDVTFDMTMSKGSAKRYDYFNLSDADIKRDHVMDTKYAPPACTTAGRDYFSANSLTVRGLAELNGYIEKTLRSGSKNILVKILNVPYTANIANQIMDIALKKYCDMHKCGASADVGYNESQMVFEININGGK